MLITAVLAGRNITMIDLSGPDRCWLVAGLTAAGLTGEEIADRTGCGVRLVRKVLADAGALIAAYAQNETQAFTGELQLARSEQRRLQLELSSTTAELGRVRNRLHRATTPAGMCPTCGQKLTRNHMYELRGRLYCREDHRQRSARYRARRKVNA